MNRFLPAIAAFHFFFRIIPPQLRFPPVAPGHQVLPRHPDLFIHSPVCTRKSRPAFKKPSPTNTGNNSICVKEKLRFLIWHIHQVSRGVRMCIDGCASVETINHSNYSNSHHVSWCACAWLGGYQVCVSIHPQAPIVGIVDAGLDIGAGLACSAILCLPCVQSVLRSFGSWGNGHTMAPNRFSRISFRERSNERFIPPEAVRLGLSRRRGILLVPHVNKFSFLVAPFTSRGRRSTLWTTWRRATRLSQWLARARLPPAVSLNSYLLHVISLVARF